MRIILILLLVGVAFSSVEAQSKKKKKKSRDAVEVQGGQPSSLDPSYPRKQYGPKVSSKKKKGSGPTYESERQYYERMADLNKAKRKNERLMETPQYSDPTYFGHKRPPKRRPPSKMKYCKVCGIRH